MMEPEWVGGVRLELALPPPVPELRAEDGDVGWHPAAPAKLLMSLETLGRRKSFMLHTFACFFFAPGGLWSSEKCPGMLRSWAWAWFVSLGVTVQQSSSKFAVLQLEEASSLGELGWFVPGRSGRWVPNNRDNSQSFHPLSVK